MRSLGGIGDHNNIIQQAYNLHISTLFILMEASMKTINTKVEEKKSKDEPKPSLPKENWFGSSIQFYDGFWCLSHLYESVISFQTHFQAHDTDIILASLPKTGTTWLKSLLFTIVNRNKYSENISKHPLYTKNAHELVPYFELGIYSQTNQPDLTNIPVPRLLSTHLPYPTLAKSIKTSKCRVVYVCRNPLDTCVSLWHFFRKFNNCTGNNIEALTPMNDFSSKFCKGNFPFGPFDSHVLGYWKESIQNPEKVLFLEYEGLKMDPKTHMKDLAEFSGCPFSEEEEKDGVVDEIIKLCSFESLKEMEVNKSGQIVPLFKNDVLFRKAEIGGWTEDLTPSMAKKFDEIQEKLNNAGFSFKYYQN